MDWLGTSEEASKTVDLAVIKVEATVPVTDPTYGGAVVLNPGIASPLKQCDSSGTLNNQKSQAALVARALDKYFEEVMQSDQSYLQVRMLAMRQPGYDFSQLRCKSQRHIFYIIKTG